MSGGFFDYQEHRLDIIADDIRSFLEGHDGIQTELSDATRNEFNEAIRLLRRTRVYVNRIDYLLCGDDGEDTFHERLRKDLEGLK